LIAMSTEEKAEHVAAPTELTPEPVAPAEPMEQTTAEQATAEPTPAEPAQAESKPDDQKPKKEKKPRAPRKKKTTPSHPPYIEVTSMFFNFEHHDFISIIFVLFLCSKF
jgi:hypothetical protein